MVIAAGTRMPYTTITARRQRILALHRLGRSTEQIAVICAVHRRTVERHLKQARDGREVRRSGAGARRSNPSDKRKAGA